jgi:chorismate mutase
MHGENTAWDTTPADARARLAPFRREIDAIDDQIVALLGKRFGIVRQVAVLKAEHAIHPVLNDRLDEVTDRARRAAERAGFDPAVAERIYRIILDASCGLETDFMASGP